MPDWWASGAGTSKPLVRADKRLSRRRIEIHFDLDRSEQLWHELYLGDDHEPVMVHETCRIVCGRAKGRGIVQEAYHCPGSTGGSQPGQGALAGLAGTIHQYDPRISQHLPHQALGVSGDQTW